MNPDSICLWCGKKYSEHDDPRPAGSPVPRVPCLLLKSGFVEHKEKKVYLGSFYGKSMYVFTEQNDSFDYAKAFKDHLETERAAAVRQYKDEQFLSTLKLNR